MIVAVLKIEVRRYANHSLYKNAPALNKGHSRRSIAPSYYTMRRSVPFALALCGVTCLLVGSLDGHPALRRRSDRRLQLRNLTRAALRNPAPPPTRRARSPQEQDAAEVREAFALYDADGDGAVSEKEFELYDTHDEYEAANYDDDGDGALDLGEFASWYHGPLDEEEIRQTFARVDADQSGSVSAAELLRWFNEDGLGDEAHFVKVIVGGYDRDGDGALDQEEFGTFLSDEDEEDAIDRYLFTVVDRDGDEDITGEEYAAFMSSYGMEMSAAEVQEEMDEFDADKNGAWNLQEFLASLSESPSNEEEIAEEFRAWDQDGDGFVSKTEVNEMLINIGAVELAGIDGELIKVADSDGDGQLSYDEFASWENMI